MTTIHGQRDDIGHAHGGGHHTSSGWRSGWVIFAAVMLLFNGAMSILEGITAILKDDVIVVTRNYAYAFDLTTWGWLHLALGIVLVLAGAALFNGALWARVVAVIGAGVSMVLQFLWLPHYPLWALVVIALDIFVIWAVCTMDRPRTAPR